MKQVFIALLVIASPFQNTSAQTFDWVKQLGGDTYVYPVDVVVDEGGNVYTAGIFGGTADFDPGSGTANLTAGGTFDVFISKLDASGNYLWAKKIGGTMITSAGAITVDASGNIHIAGHFEGTVDFDPGAGTLNIASAGQDDVFVTKLDASGNLIWAQTMGGSVTDYARDIYVDDSGNVYTTGHFEGTSDYDPGSGMANLTSEGASDVFVSKLDASGNYVWAKSMGGPSSEFATSITVDLSSNVYTTGFFQNNADFDPGVGVNILMTVGMNGAFISKLDASGNFVWAKGTSSGDVISGESGTAITVDDSGNTYISGSFFGTSDFDPGAGTALITSAGQNDIFFLKLDNSGNHVWSKSIGGPGSDIVRAIDIDDNSNVYTSGYFDGSSDFDPGAGQVNLTSEGSFDVFVSKLDSSGNYNWAVAMGGTGSDFSHSIVVDPAGNIFTTGYFQDIVDFDPGAGNFILTQNASSESDGFVHKMNPSSLSVEQGSFGHSIEVFPNPSSANVYISLGQDYDDLKVNIFNGQGRLVHSQLINNVDTIPLNIDFLWPGVYFLKIHSGLNQTTMKIIKQ
jgi:hypothetical protein